MKKKALVDRVDSFFENFAERAINHRWIVVCLALVFVSGGFYFASKAQTDNSLAAFFDKSDPAYIAYMDYLDDYLSDEVTYILYRAPGKEHGPFDLDTMKQIAHLTTALENEVPFARKVTSLANVEFIRAHGDDILIDELLLDFPETQDELLVLKQALMAKPLYVNYLINDTGEYGAIIVDMSLASTDPLDKIIHDPEAGTALMNLYPQVSDTAVREILARPEYSGIEFALTGDAPMNSAYNQIYTDDSAIITLATLVLAALLSLILFRASLVGLVGPISVVIASIIITMGFIGAIGWKVGMFFAMVPSLLCAVGIAQSVHILLEYQRALSTTGDKTLATKAALKKVGGPCLMAALTTATGFLVMSVSELKGLSELAFYSSFGVMTTFLLTISLLVVFLAGSKKKTTESSREMAANPLVLRYIQHCITFNQKRPKLIAILGLAIGITGLAGVFQLKVDFNFFDDFKDHVPWKMESVLAEEVMGGLLNVTYVIDTSKAEGIKDPAIIAAIEKIQRYAEQQPLVEKTFSLADIIKDLNRSFHGDDDSYYKLPESRELLAQYLLTYEVSGGEELWELVTLDFSRTAVEMRVKITDATKINALIASINDFIAQNPIPGAEVKQTGIGLLWVKICDYIANTQMVSYSLVLLMIAIFMSLSFGSLKVGLFAMIPNIFPIIVVLGFMGWRGIHLDYMKLLLATIAIGIAVDDTIHLFTRLRKHFNESGNYKHAMAQALTDVGPALVITSIILVVSFSTFLFSNMNVLSSFGLLLAGSISTALLADIYLMPALTLLVKPFGPERAVSTTAEPEFSNESTPNQQALTEGTI